MRRHPKKPCISSAIAAQMQIRMKQHGPPVVSRGKGSPDELD